MAMVERFHRPWMARDIAMAVFLVILAVWACRDPFTDIFRVATKDLEQSHILLVPIVAAWLFWLRRSRLRYIRYQPSALGPLLILAGWLGVWWGYETDTRVLWHAGAITTVLGAVLTLAGGNVLRQFLPAFVVFIFAIPVPGFLRQGIARPLQEWAAIVTNGFLEVLGVDAIREGSVLIIRGQQVAVGEACNGMRMVFALGLVVYAFVFSTPFKTGTRLVLLALSPVIALVCNIIRLIPTSIIYGYGDPATAEMFHDLAGWVMLPIALLMLIGVLKLLRWLELPVTTWRLAET
jgi:exosortase